MINVVFMGRKPVASQALKWIASQDNIKVLAVVTDSHLSVSPTQAVSDAFSIPVITRDELEDKVESGEFEVDLSVSILYWQKIRHPLISSSKRGVINFHPAPLPEYKGTAGYNLAILESLSKWAVSAHYVDENIDTGEIIEVSWFDIDRDDETAKSLEEKSQPILLEQFKRVVGSALDAQGFLPSSPNIGGRYISRDKMEAMKEVKDSDDVERKIRAFWFPPYDGAYKMINGVKCTLVNRPILNSLASPDVSNLFTVKS